MKNSITLWINREKHTISGKDIFRPLSSYLREDCELTGTKVVCGEGDCGACSVLMKDEHSQDEQYVAINSCIAYLYGLNNKQILTIEHLSQHDDIQKLQKNFVDCGASQCGYCTPGIICSLGELYQKKNRPQSKHVKNALTGNLCRCTGYQSIIQASVKTKLKQTLNLNDQINDHKQQIQAQQSIGPMADQDQEPAESVEIKEGNYLFHAPVSWPEALELKHNHPGLKIVANLTDLGVVLNKLRVSHFHILSLQNILTTQTVFERDDKLIITPAATIHHLEEYCEDKFEEVSSLLRVFASPQIKNRATIIGNVANGSPIGDTIPFLLLAEAQIKLVSKDDERVIALSDFYRGYKQFDLKANELIKCLILSLPKLRSLNQGHFRLYKISKRKDLDISAVTVAMSLEKIEDKIQSINLWVGGVGPVVQQINISPDIVSEIEQGKMESGQAKIIQTSLEQINPLSDHRGSAQYRNQLVANLIKKFFFDEELISYKVSTEAPAEL